MKKITTLLFASFFLISCTYPSTSVTISDNRPSIAIEGAPANAILYVDGLRMGAVQQFNSQQTLLLEPGNHKVEVISQGATLFSEEIFLGGGEVKTIKIIGRK